MKKGDNKNLPIVSNNNFKTKIKKAIFVLFSSFGIATSVASSTYANERTNLQETMDETDVNKLQREKFLSELKVNFSKNNEDIVDKLAKNRKQEFSIATGHKEDVKQILVKTLDKIDKNFDRNAQKKGKLAFSKREFKEKYISLISNLDNIIFVKDDDKPNQYTQYFKDRKSAGACYVIKQVENDLGVIPKNVIIMRDVKNLEYNMIHELTHKLQTKNNSKVFLNYNNIITMLKEGHSNNMAEYVRGTKLFGTNDSITHSSLTDYGIPTIIYNKLSYLVGAREMDEYMQNSDPSDQKTVQEFLSEKLDNKYGEGTGEEIYKYITNLSLWFTNYSGPITPQRVEDLYQSLDEKHEIIKQGGQSETIDSILNVHSNFRQMLDNIYDRDTKMIDRKALEDEFNKQLKGIEMISLKCINKDIGSIHNKNDAIDYVQLWDYYRNRCAVSKFYGVDEEETLLSDNFKKLREVQKNLYGKCKKYGALNIKDEAIFNILIESHLYNVSNATISYNKNKTKLVISDEYIENEFDIRIKKDGSKKYDSMGIWSNKKGIVKGTKVLAQKELDKNLGSK